MNGHPISLTVDDDLKRYRVTVFFRLIVIIPHAIWLFLWGIAVFLAVIVNWFATLILGRSPNDFHSFIGSYVRYATHVTAYFFLITDEYPGFTGRPGFPVDIQIAPPADQNRWKTLFRIFLAIPAMMLATALTGGGGSGSGQSNNSVGVLQTVGFLGWFASLVKGEMPRGMRNLGAYSVGYAAQSWAYAFLLTDRYPNSDPIEMGSAEPLPEHPVAMTVDDDLRRSRLTVFFRLLLTIPHFVWLFLWGIAVFFAIIANWFATLFTGQSPESLHRFLSAYLRYGIHVSAYLFLVGNPFPGFVGESYDVDVRVAAPERQNRWITGFRIFLGIPAVFISSALFGALWVAAILAWFASLALGRMPLGLRNLGAHVLRYSAQVNAYYYVLTDTYPFSGPPALTEPAEAGSQPPSVDASPAPSV